MTNDEIDAILNPLREVLARKESTPETIVIEAVPGGWATSIEDTFDTLAISRGYWPTARAHELSIRGVDV